MQLSIALAVQKCEAVGAQKFLLLLVEHGRPHISALRTNGHHRDLGNRVLSPMSIEVAFPKALKTEVIPTVVTW